jgi:hypothetical protein
MSDIYRHTQTGWVIIGSAAAVLALGWVVLPAGASAGVRLPFLLVAALMALLFGTLTVAVDTEAVRLRYGVGLIRKTIPLVDVQACREVRNPWYVGWGIRLAPSGVVWNVSGFDAVELDLPHGKRFRIGTDEPVALAAALATTKGVAVAPQPAARPEAGPRPRAIAWLVSIAAIGIGAVLVLGIFRGSLRPPVVRVGPEGLRVDTPFYGATFPAGDIVSVSLEPRLPRVLMKTNGFDGAGTLRGRFRLEGWGEGRLYVDVGMSPYVVVRLRQGYVVINFRDPERTRALYDEIARQWPDRVSPRAVPR